MCAIGSVHEVPNNRKREKAYCTEKKRGGQCKKRCKKRKQKEKKREMKKALLLTLISTIITSRSLET